jgi:hypothetical protein
MSAGHDPVTGHRRQISRTVAGSKLTPKRYSRNSLSKSDAVATLARAVGRVPEPNDEA